MCYIMRSSTGGGWGVRQEAVRTIRFWSYSIRSGHNGRLDSALRVMSHANVNLGVFQETKVTEGYTQEGQ